MKWYSNWNGTGIEAENEKDNEFLEKLYKTLLKKAYRAYGSGEIVREDEDGLVKLWFER